MDRGKRLRWWRAAAGDYRYGPYRVLHDGRRQLNGGLGWTIYVEQATRFAYTTLQQTATLSIAKRIVEHDAAKHRHLPGAQ